MFSSPTLGMHSYNPISFIYKLWTLNIEDGLRKEGKKTLFPPTWKQTLQFCLKKLTSSTQCPMINVSNAHWRTGPFHVQSDIHQNCLPDTLQLFQLYRSSIPSVFCQTQRSWFRSVVSMFEQKWPTLLFKISLLTKYPTDSSLRFFHLLDSHFGLERLPEFTGDTLW